MRTIKWGDSPGLAHDPSASQGWGSRQFPALGRAGLARGTAGTDYFGHIESENKQTEGSVQMVH